MYCWESAVLPMLTAQLYVAVAVLVSVVAIAIQGLNGIPIALFILVLAFPFIQLGGSVLSALVIASVPDLRREARAWKRLGWITLGTILGCVLGIFIMYLLVVAHR